MCLSYMPLGIDVDANLTQLTFLSERQFLEGGFLPLMPNNLKIYYYTYDDRARHSGPWSKAVIQGAITRLSQSSSYRNGSLPLSSILTLMAFDANDTSSYTNSIETFINCLA
uniref:Uncharacterized protein n=1 Tax=Acrobeloides nanus TaxID=290746 RepID=A0A914DRL9_9BILA